MRILSNPLIIPALLHLLLVGDSNDPPAPAPQLLFSSGFEDGVYLGTFDGDSNPKHQWIDDIEIWDSLPQ